MNTRLLLISSVYTWSTWSMFIHRDLANSPTINVNEAEYINVATYKTVEGVTRYKKQQQYNGVDIFAATIVIEEGDDNTLSAVSGNYYDTTNIKSDFNDDVTATITSDEALQIAISNYIPNGDKTDLFGYAWGESERTTSVHLYLYKNEDDGINTFTLSYIVQFTYQQTETQDVDRTFSVINAKTGAILYSFGAMVGQQDNDAWGTGGNAKVGDERHGPMPIQGQQLKSDRVETYKYPLVGSNNPTLGECEFETPSICEIQDELVNTAKCALADAYMWAGTVFDLFDDWGPKNAQGNPIPPLAPQNLPLRFYVHYGTNFENAFYSGGAMYFGDGNTRFYPLVSLDVSSHEVAHGFTDQGSGLVYRDQSGGINEAYSDLAGEAAEAYYRGKESVKWICGYDIDKAGCSYSQCGLRYLYNPPLDGNSIDHVNNYFNGQNVHYSSGIYNKGWYNLATMALYESWDIQDVFLLASQANYYHWSSNTNFAQGLCGLQAAVEDIYPQNEWEGRKQDIALAWQNQGVFCQTTNDNTIKSSNPLTGDAEIDSKIYFIYGGVAAAIFAIVVIVMILYIYKRKAKILRDQLNIGNDDNAYGTIATQ